MFSIAICDDEEFICSQIENIILDFAKVSYKDIEIDVYYSGEELCDFMKKRYNYDLIFLDIELKLLNGVMIGKKIREEMDNQIVQIVYISSKENYYRELFQVRPMDFINKPIESNKIIHDIKLAFKLTNKLGGIFSYKKGHRTYRQVIKNIIYFESDNREIKMITPNDTIRFYGKLNDIYKELEKYKFLYIHKSFIANYYHVKEFGYENLKMSNNEILPISQKRRKDIGRLQIKYEKEDF